MSLIMPDYAGLQFMNKKRIKHAAKQCIFCKNNKQEQLDVHRINPGSNGGEYTNDNIVVVCCNCHRKLHHTNEIKIDGWFMSTMGKVLHCFINNEENYLKG